MTANGRTESGDGGLLARPGQTCEPLSCVTAYRVLLRVVVVCHCVSLPCVAACRSPMSLRVVVVCHCASSSCATACHSLVSLSTMRRRCVLLRIVVVCRCVSQSCITVRRRRVSLCIIVSLVSYGSATGPGRDGHQPYYSQPYYN